MGDRFVKNSPTDRYV